LSEMEGQEGQMKEVDGDRSMKEASSCQRWASAKLLVKNASMETGKKTKLRLEKS
jgi:hypothetical protein